MPSQIANPGLSPAVQDLGLSVTLTPEQIEAEKNARKKKLLRLGSTDPYSAARMALLPASGS